MFNTILAMTIDREEKTFQDPQLTLPLAGPEVFQLVRGLSWAPANTQSDLRHVQTHFLGAK